MRIFQPIISGSLTQSGSAVISGSLAVTNGITGSVFGTSSWAVSASYAPSSNAFPFIGNAQITGSLLVTGSVIISGSKTGGANPSIKIDGGVQLDGYLRFEPVDVPINTSISASYIYVSGSTNDLYFSQNGNLVKWKWVEGILETGLLYGGAVTYSGSNVFVSPGSGIIADHNATTGSEVSPMIEYVTWNAITQSITNIATQQVTYLYIDNTGTLQQQSTRFTSQQYHDYIPLGAVGHFDYTQVSAFGGGVQTAYDQISQISNFVDAFGPLKMSGYGLTGQAGSLRLSVGSGTSFIHGGFYQNNPEFPSQITTPLQATASLARVQRSGSVITFDTNAGNLYTVVDPTQYDRDGDGILHSVGSSNWSIQRVFTDPKTGVLYVYYGQARYTSLLNALQYLPTDPFTEGDTFDFTTFVGFLVLKGNASDITNTASNSIINGGLFRGSGQGSGGGIALSNLEDLTDVSITSPINGQALIYDTGIWQNGVPTNSTSASYALTASYLAGYVSPFPFTGSAIITGSLIVTGSIVSTNGITGSVFGTSSWAVNATTASLVNGNVNVSTATIGNTTYATISTSAGAGTTSIYSVPNSTYSSIFVDYSINEGTTNARAGTIQVISVGSNLNFTETTTMDIGNTNDISWYIYLSGADINFEIINAAGASWTIKFSSRQM